MTNLRRWAPLLPKLAILSPSWWAIPRRFIILNLLWVFNSHHMTSHSFYYVQFAFFNLFWHHWPYSHCDHNFYFCSLWTYWSLFGTPKPYGAHTFIIDVVMGIYSGGIGVGFYRDYFLGIGMKTNFYWVMNFIKGVLSISWSFLGTDAKLKIFGLSAISFAKVCRC